MNITTIWQSSYDFAAEAARELYLKSAIPRWLSPRTQDRENEMTMMIPIRTLTAVVLTFAAATLSSALADDTKPLDLGKATEFKGKALEMKDKDEVAILLSVEPGKEFHATTKGKSQTDVHLFVYDEAGTEVAKDDSSGPLCSVKITPAKAEKFKFVIKNSNGDNTVTFEVKLTN